MTVAILSDGRPAALDLNLKVGAARRRPAIAKRSLKEISE